MAARSNSLRDRQIGECRLPCDRPLVGPGGIARGSNSRTASLKKILNLNHTLENNASDAQSNGLVSPAAAIVNEDGEPIWKVLVFDDLGRDVISSVMRVSDLRSLGVTMHM